MRIMSDLNRIVSTALCYGVVYRTILYVNNSLALLSDPRGAGVVESDYSVNNSKDSAPRSSVHSSWHEDKNAKLNLTRLANASL